MYEKDEHDSLNPIVPDWYTGVSVFSFLASLPGYAGEIIVLIFIFGILAIMGIAGIDKTFQNFVRNRADSQFTNDVVIPYMHQQLNNSSIQFEQTRKGTSMGTDWVQYDCHCGNRYISAFGVRIYREENSIKSYKLYVDRFDSYRITTRVEIDLQRAKWLAYEWQHGREWGLLKDIGWCIL